MNKELFVDKNPTLETSWRSVILLGRNVASYKFARDWMKEVSFINPFAEVCAAATPTTP